MAYLFWTTAVSLWVTAFIHLMPLIGLSGVSALNRLYGVSISDPNLILLMRHRAVLFGLLGVALIALSFSSRGQIFGLVAGFIAVCAFLVLARGDFTSEIQRVVLADKVALTALVIGSCCWVARVALANVR